MDKPHYELVSKTIGIILELVKTCKKVDLGNVSFSYYGLSNTTFNLVEYKDYWQLVVSSEAPDSPGRSKSLRDVYKIVDDMQLVYLYSERD